MIARRTGRHGNHARGERNGKHRLREDQIRTIRRAYQRGRISLRELADAYGVGKSTVGDVVKRRTWRHVEDERRAAA